MRKGSRFMPKAVNHVAVTVTDIQKAMKWYRDVMGMTVLAEPMEISGIPLKEKDKHISNLVRTVFGQNLGKFLICHLVSSNGVGIELFEFIEPKTERRKENFDYWKTGFFHISVTEPEIEKMAEKIDSSGGKRRTKVLELFPRSGKKICFCEDPFGNIIEIYSHSYKQFWSNVQP